MIMMNSKQPVDRTLAEMFPPTARPEAERLATELRERIVREHLFPGTRLGSEQDLIRWSGRSRATVREAFRLLAEQGLMTARPGPKGGLFVATPGPDRVARSLGILLSLSDVSLGELLQARMEVESAAVGIAATQRTRADLEGLEQSCLRFGRLLDSQDGEGQVEENLTFHTELVRASHNTVLVVLHAALHHLIRASTVEPIYTVAAATEVKQAHERICRALRDQDRDAAIRRVRRHLAAFEEYLRRSDQYELLQRRFRLGG